MSPGDHCGLHFFKRERGRDRWKYLFRSQSSTSWGVGLTTIFVHMPCNYTCNTTCRRRGTSVWKNFYWFLKRERERDWQSWHGRSVSSCSPTHLKFFTSLLPFTKKQNWKKVEKKGIHTHTHTHTQTTQPTQTTQTTQTTHTHNTRRSIHFSIFDGCPSASLLVYVRDDRRRCGNIFGHQVRSVESHVVACNRTAQRFRNRRSERKCSVIVERCVEGRIGADTDRTSARLPCVRSHLCHIFHNLHSLISQIEDPNIISTSRSHNFVTDFIFRKRKNVVFTPSVPMLLTE